MASIENLNWMEHPPEPLAQLIKIYSPRNGSAVRGVLLGPEELWIVTHYFNGRTIPCRQPCQYCYGCVAKCQKRVKGYMAAWCTTYCRKVLLEISRNALVELHAEPGKYKVFNRGTLLKVSRRGEAKNAPLVLDPDRWPGNLSLLPQPFDMKAALIRIWNGKQPPDLQISQPA